MEYRPDSGSASLRFDVGRPDDLAPLLGVVSDELAKIGGTVLAGSPDDFGKLIVDDTEKWAKVIKSAGIKAE